MIEDILVFHITITFFLYQKEELINDQTSLEAKPFFAFLVGPYPFKLYIMKYTQILFGTFNKTRIEEKNQKMPTTKINTLTNLNSAQIH